MPSDIVFSGRSEIGRIYVNPGMYLGMDKKVPRQEIGITVDDGEIILCTLDPYDTPVAVKQLLYEILTNAADNCQRSRERGVDPKLISVNMDDETISVTNYGLPLPVVQKVKVKEGQDTKLIDYNPKKHKNETPVWLPNFIFGQVGTSSNYDRTKPRTGAGTNGIGAKILNIFSKSFIVESWDSERGLYYKGVWRDNMFMNSDDKAIETIEEMDIAENKVTITWTLDFKRFDMEGYSDLDMMLFAKCVADFSMTCKVKTVFNDIEFNIQRITDYARLALGKDVYNSSKHLSYFEWSDKKTSKRLSKLDEDEIIEKVSFSQDIKEFPTLELLVVDTPSAGDCYGFANGISATGTHTKGAITPISKYLCKLINGEKKPGEKKKKNEVRIGHVKNHITIFVNARVLNPDFDSQLKNVLNFPEVSVKIPEKTLTQFGEWKVLRCLEAEVKSMDLMAASVHDGKKKRHIGKIKGHDANKAGGPESMKCELFIVEGDSASQYIKARIPHLEGNNDYYGHLPVRGKFLNVTKASAEQYEANKEVQDIKKYMGFREGVDYSDPVNLGTLRYGKIVFATDADDDGVHIMAILLNFIHEKFPGFLENDRVFYLKTPLVRIVKKDKVLKNFFSRADFKDYESKHSIPSGAKVKYYKGLGSSKELEVEEDVSSAPIIEFKRDEEYDASLSVAFHPENARERKQWVRDYRLDDKEDVDIDATKNITYKSKLEGEQEITSFINVNLVGFTVSSFFRAIPSYFDTLKRSHRQIIYSLLEKDNYKETKETRKVSPKTSAIVMDIANYAFGDASLHAAITHLAKNYPGANNLNYLIPDGSFGSVIDHNAAHPRYICTGVEGWLPLIYCKESIDLVPRVIDEDVECEPRWLPSVIPMGVVNGFVGVATAHSTSCEPHNPYDVINWFQRRCKGEHPDPIQPWYRNFNGKIEIVRKSDVYDEGNEIMEVDMDEFEDGSDDVDDSIGLLRSARNSKLSCMTYGRFRTTEEKGHTIVTIEELPPRVSYEKYTSWLEGEMSKKKEKMIKDFTANLSRKGGKTEMKIVIKWHPNYPREPNHSNLRLVKRFGISNLILIDQNGFPKKFSGVNALMEQHFINMSKHYKLVRENRVGKLKENLEKFVLKRKFIQLVIDEEIILKADIDEINVKLQEHNIPESYHKDVKCHEIEKRTVERLDKKIEELKKEIKAYKKVTWDKIWLEKLDALEKYLRKNWKV